MTGGTEPILRCSESLRRPLPGLVDWGAGNEVSLANVFVPGGSTQNTQMLAEGTAWGLNSDSTALTPLKAAFP